LANHSARHASLPTSHELEPGQTAEGYDSFDTRDDDWTKMLRHP
jgi:hypothetical protein